MITIVWSERAFEDIDRLVEQADSADLGSLLDAIENAPQLLVDFPGAGMAHGHAGLRKWLIKGTPFLLLYRANGQSVEVVRVMHRASDWAGLL